MHVVSRPGSAIHFCRLPDGESVKARSRNGDEVGGAGPLDEAIRSDDLAGQIWVLLAIGPILESA